MTERRYLIVIEGAEGENKNVMFFRNRNGLGLPPAKMEAAQKKGMVVGPDNE